MFISLFFFSKNERIRNKFKGFTFLKKGNKTFVILNTLFFLHCLEFNQLFLYDAEQEKKYLFWNIFNVIPTYINLYY